MDKVLITGGAGFIGSHIARFCLAKGLRVAVLDSLRTGHAANLEGLHVDFTQGSVEDAALVQHVAQGARYVFHLAALVSVPESMAKPQETERINVLGTINVLEAAKRAGCERVVFSSTSAVYGDVERPIHAETDLPEPVSPYAISKLAAEHYMHLYARAHGVPTAVLRSFNVFGPRQDPKSPYAAAVAIFADKARTGAPLRIFGDGQQTRDFIFVEDVVRANWTAAQNGNGTCNVATGEKITVRALAEKIIRLCGSNSIIEHAEKRAGDVLHSRGDATRLRTFGWAPQVDLEEGLRRTLAPKD